MTTIAKISPKRSALSKLSRKDQPVDSVLQSLEVVNSLEAELIQSLESFASAEKKSSDLFASWNERSGKAALMKERAETPEALQAMDVLSVKASRFADFYKQLSARDQEKCEEVRTSLKNIRLVQKQLIAVEKTQALDATLRKMADDANIVIDASPSLDHREISRVIHSAQALVELKTGRL